MNELEKALEQLNIKYETNGKQYKIPTTKENLVELLKAYIAMTINLQSKIDKAIELIKSKLSTETYQHLKKLYDDIDGTEEIWEDYEFEDLRDILKEDK